MAAIIQKFAVETDAPAYFPGSSVKGQVHLRTNGAVHCSEISLNVMGAARCFTDAQQPSHSSHQYVYYRRTMTVLGSSLKTENGVLEEDGIRFDTPASPDGGKVCIPFSNRRKFLVQLIGCSGEEEHILGSARISPTSVIDNCRSRKQTDLPLTLDGAFPTAVMHFTATWQLSDTGDCQVMRLGEAAEIARIVAFDISGVRLRKLSDSISAMEHFYCRITTDSNTKSETTGANQMMIPAGDLVLPFVFKLPEKLAPSIDTEQGSSIRYSITCAVEGRREVGLPSAVCHFTVIKSDAKPSQDFMTPWTQTTVPRKPWFSCNWSGPMVQMVTQMCQRVYMPGETMKVRVKGENLLHTPVAIRIDLIRAHQIRTPQSTERIFTEFNLLPDVGVDKKKSFCFDWNVPFPPVAPNYNGTDEEFAPLTWDYHLLVSVKENSHTILTHNTAIMAAAFPTELKGEAILHPQPEKEALPTEQESQKKIIAEGRGIPLQFAPDFHSMADRALNKIVEKGRCVEVPFVPVYSSFAEALPQKG